MKFIKYITILTLLVTSYVNSTNKPETTKPNVILIITDDQGYGDVGVLGNQLIQTPNIDSFHKESYHLTNFHVGPTCAPTRSALMTGRYANSVGVWHTVGGWSLLREGEKTLADMFADSGYKTGGFGKWHLGDNYDFRPENRGFQETVMHGGGGVHQTPDFWNNDYFDDTYYKNGEPKKYKGYCTDIFFNEALRFIKKNKDQPFFCYLAPNAPHGPYNVPVEYYNKYKNISADKLTEKQKRFYGMITNIDDNFGKLRDALTELKIADNTILIFMTDNGTSAGYSRDGKKGYNAGMRGTKGSPYEGGHRVPFFIHWKNGKLSKSKDINQLTAQIDIMPTLADLCNIDLPKNHKKIDGKSIVPFFKRPSKKDNRMVITDSQRIQRPEKWRGSAVMQNKWRLVNGKELYNIEKDQGQKQNIAAKNPKKVKEMRAFYEKWWQQVAVDFDKEVYIKVGSKNENPVTLTAHDVHAPNGNQPWNQNYIREGSKGYGYWTIDVVAEGDYLISLKRYPTESNLGINDTVEGTTTQQNPGLEYDIPAGVNMNYKKAFISIGKNATQQTRVAEDDLSAKFKVHLNKGQQQFKASFQNNKGEDNVAYYVYIEKL
ncbi:arylsulfatase [Wenyingzhuangia aestuarii]|uniref:arylsulfatase n=1 Tax=Wenyingzhuangia aestuarii TaxID=1647582 RepID=UPI0014393D60|nr:arylsulfatase [Wenyingzhuangia aestuarii]NJB81786.1 arylsulfatase A-like enzyme [Wenyingzhuangia aestuarii]